MYILEYPLHVSNLPDYPNSGIQALFTMIQLNPYLFIIVPLNPYWSVIIPLNLNLFIMIPLKPQRIYHNYFNPKLFAIIPFNPNLFATMPLNLTVFTTTYQKQNLINPSSMWIHGVWLQNVILIGKFGFGSRNLVLTFNFGHSYGF